MLVAAVTAIIIIFRESPIEVRCLNNISHDLVFLENFIRLFLSLLTHILFISILPLLSLKLHPVNDNMGMHYLTRFKPKFINHAIPM